VFHLLIGWLFLTYMSSFPPYNNMAILALTSFHLHAYNMVMPQAWILFDVNFFFKVNFFLFRMELKKIINFQYTSHDTPKKMCAGI
jgi:hypothetical protein